MLNKKFLGRDLDRPFFSVFLHQLFFLSAAVFLFFTFTFIVNALSLEYRVFPEVFSSDLIHIVVFSPVVDTAVFYLSSAFLLLFPLLNKGRTESWRWTMANYLPLSLSLAGFLFHLTAFGRVFLSLSCVLCLLWVFVHSARHHRWRFQTRKGLANILMYACIVFLLIETFGFVFWVQFPFLGTTEQGGFFQRMAMVDLQLFYVPAFLAPFLVLLTLFAWLLTPFRLWLKKTKGLILRFAGKELNLIKTFSVDLAFSGFKVLDRKPWNILFLIISLLSSVVYGFYAYHPVLFGRERFVGVDTANYIAFLEDMRRGDVSYALSYAFFNLSDRSLSVSFLYSFSILFGLPSTVVAQFSPLVIGSLVVVATYFFVREAGYQDGMCLLGGAFSSFSLLMIKGVYAAFISNMMAWIALLFFSGFLVKALRSKSWVFCFLAGCTLTSVLFMHVYTWSLIMIVLVCLGFLLLMEHVRGFSSLFRFKLVSAIVASNVVTELARHLVVSVKGFSATTIVGVAQIGLSLVFVWSTVSSLHQKYLTGLLMSPVMLFLVVIGVLTVVCDVWRKDFCLFLKCWVMAPSFFFVFGDSVVHSRILYVFPFHVFAALGIVVFDCWIRQRFKGAHGRILAALLVVLFLLANVNYALRSMNTFSMLDFS